MKREEKNWVKCCATFFHSFVSTSFDWLMREMIQSIKCRWVIAVAISHHFSHSNSLNKKKKLIPSFVEMKTKNAMICLNGEGNKWWRINSSLTLQKRTKLKINYEMSAADAGANWLINFNWDSAGRNERINERKWSWWVKAAAAASSANIHSLHSIHSIPQAKWIHEWNEMNLLLAAAMS